MRSQAYVVFYRSPFLAVCLCFTPSSLNKPPFSLLDHTNSTFGNDFLVPSNPTIPPPFFFFDHFNLRQESLGVFNRVMIDQLNFVYFLNHTPFSYTGVDHETLYALNVEVVNNLNFIIHPNQIYLSHDISLD